MGHPEPRRSGSYPTRPIAGFGGRTIVVNGAGSGLGRCLARQLGERGATIACVDYNETFLKETIALLESQATPCTAHVADVSDAEAVAQVVAEIDATHDGFDGLVNNAGIMQAFTAISDLAVEDIERITQVNYWGMVMLVKASLPILRSRPRAHIVNISSLSALVPFPGQTAYSASKAAMRIFSEGLETELRGTGVSVVLAMPGAMRTALADNSPFHSEEAKARLREITERTRLGLKPERVAARIIEAMERGNPRLVMGGDAWVLDKCYRIAPVTTNRLLRWALQRSPVAL